MTTTISGSNGIDKVAAGAVTKDKLPAGTVLQVVSARFQDYVQTTSTSWTDLGLSASITPASASSKILIFFSLTGCGSDAVSNGGAFRLTKNGSLLIYTDNFVAYLVGSSANRSGATSGNYLDSPATTSSTTYAIQWRSINAGTFRVNDYTTANADRGFCSITLMEIAA